MNARILFGSPGSHKHGGIVAAHESVHGVTGLAGREAIDRTYWEAVPRVGWRQAFEQSFGMTVEDVYVRFEAWRALGFPG